MKDRLARQKGRRSTAGYFFRIPAEVLDSANVRMASSKAKALLLDMGAQFRGGNNGDICITWSDLRSRGWKSKDTMRRAMLELLRLGLIEQTRQGGLHWPSLFAFTWLPIDSCGGKLDVPPSATPSSRWRLPPAPDAPPRKKNPPPRPSGQRVPTIGAAVQNVAPTIGAVCPDHRG
jgi:hypothetical protein